MNKLENEIVAAIQSAGGAIPFARFMELALYTPGWGYYEQPDHSPGRAGDFFTNVSVGPLFGQLLAERFAGWLESVGEPPLCLVEAGGHDGRLAADLLGHLQARHPRRFEQVQYWLLEPSATRQAWQQATLARFGGKVKWAKDWEGLPSNLRGILFSNELLDAFPAHRLGWDARQGVWFEWGVGHQCGRFVWERLGEPPADLIPDLPQALLEVLPDGFSTEVCPAATAWWSAAAQHLRQGWLLTVDYGLEGLEFFTPGRTQGTLRAYRQHRQVAEILAAPGQQDLTCHVHFDALRQAGEAAGLTTVGLLDQSQFLLQIAAELERAPAGRWEWTPERRRQWHTLTHPEHLGQRFRVLIQRRLPPAPR